MVRFIIIIIFVIVHSLYAQENQCDQIAKWLYKDLTLHSFEESFKKLQLKLHLAGTIARDNSKAQNIFKDDELIKAFKQISPNEASYQEFEKSHPYYSDLDSRFYRIKRRLSNWNSSNQSLKSLETTIKTWSNLQHTRPHLFNGLKKDQYFNEWDQFVIETIISKNYSSFDISDELENKAKRIQQKLSNSGGFHLLSGDKVKLTSQLDDLNLSVRNNLQSQIEKIQKEFAFNCSKDALEESIRTCQAGIQLDDNLLSNIDDFQLLLKSEYFAQAIKPTPLTQAPFEIKKHKLYRNHKDTICERDTKLLDSITFHHTAGDIEDTIQDLNNFHTMHRDWHMIGYHYTIDRLHTSSPQVNEARPLKFRGAHAKGKRKMSYTRYLNVKDAKTRCAHKEDELYSEQYKPAVDSRYIEGNFTSVGVAFTGHFSKHKVQKVSGIYYPLISDTSATTSLSFKALSKAAELACHLQKKYPSITKLHSHQYFVQTLCPGEIIHDIQKIAQLASNLGCQFQVVVK